MMVLRALLIGHDKVARHELKRLLNAKHFECREVSAPNEALRFSSPHGIDLIVADDVTQNGDESSIITMIAAGAFGEHPPPLIICYDGKDAVDVGSQYHVGLPIRLAKPVTEENLAAALEKALP